MGREQLTEIKPKIRRLSSREDLTFLLEKEVVVVNGRLSLVYLNRPRKRRILFISKLPGGFLDCSYVDNSDINYDDCELQKDGSLLAKKSYHNGWLDNEGAKRMLIEAGLW